MQNLRLTAVNVLAQVIRTISLAGKNTLSGKIALANLSQNAKKKLSAQSVLILTIQPVDVLKSQLELTEQLMV